MTKLSELSLAKFANHELRCQLLQFQLQQAIAAGNAHIEVMRAEAGAAPTDRFDPRRRCFVPPDVKTEPT